MATRSVSGREINAALRLRGLTQWDLARRAGISQASLSAALRGQQDWTEARKAQLARAVAELGLLNHIAPGKDEPCFEIPEETE